MNLLPKVKKHIKKEQCVDLSGIHWHFSENMDYRVIAAAKRVSDDLNGYPVYVAMEDGSGEGYRIEITEKEAFIGADGGAGAFYGIQTLAQMIHENHGRVSCCVIEDEPDMSYRGFYHDITRGKIPTLDTLKELVDRLAACKINSLQLYVEHVFAFPQYAPCVDWLGCISEEELKELDTYCYERFIDFIPSLSCFGHLYHLIQDCGFGHLSELKDYKPLYHYWIERMNHHTINPLKEESKELIFSMIDQYASIFRSRYFNICGDETFDLGYDVNKNQDKGKLYFDFIYQLVTHLQEKGKTVMMWGDVIIEHPEYIKKLPEGIIFLNWGYESRVPEARFEPFARLRMTQIVCPGTNTWKKFCENIEVEEKNIALLTGYGRKYGAKGVLLTNWGDFGNICSLEMAAYGMICAASVAWDNATVFDKEFRRKVSKLIYGNSEAVELLAGLSPVAHHADWNAIVRYDGLRKIKPEDSYFEMARNIMTVTTSERNQPEIYENGIEQCRRLEEKLEHLQGLNSAYAEEMQMAIQGTALLVKWNAACRFYKLDCYVDYDHFRTNYESLWLSKNKKSELEEVLAVFDRAEAVWKQL